VVDDLDDPRRQEPSFELDEREMLEAWLEFHRATLLLKCEGLDDAGRKHRPVATSKLSLHGLVRHMAEVERNWFRRVLLHRWRGRLVAGANVIGGRVVSASDCMGRERVHSHALTVAGEPRRAGVGCIRQASVRSRGAGPRRAAVGVGARCSSGR
jgi:hypothetical protein